MKKIEIWRICTYFIVYSVIGFLLETTFAFLVYHVIESRQSFLYGPFCSIYGVGATLMIVILKGKENNNFKLFLKGMLLGSVAEYILSFLGEKVLGMRFWDYSHEILNIKGRICLLFSIIWGIAAFILLKFINPKIDEYIDRIYKNRESTFKVLICIIMIFIIIDGTISYLATNYFIADSAQKYNLDLANEEQVFKIYNFAQKHPILKEKFDKFATAERIILFLPNVSTVLKDGAQFKLQELTPEVRNCYIRFE